MVHIIKHFPKKFRKKKSLQYSSPNYMEGYTDTIWCYYFMRKRIRAFNLYKWYIITWTFWTTSFAQIFILYHLWFILISCHGMVLFNDILQRCNISYVDVYRQFVRTIKLSFVIVSPLTLSEISVIIYSIQRFIHNNV